MMQPTLLDKGLSESVLTVGEFFLKEKHGGIASVLRSYSNLFPEFKFIPSFRSDSFTDKIKYDLGSLFRLGLKLLCDKKIRIVHIHTAAGGSFTKHIHYARLARIMNRKVIIHCHASSFKDWYESLDAHKAKRIVTFINSTDRFVVLSESWMDYFKAIGVYPSILKTINNITPFPISCRGTKSPAGAAPRLLFLGEIGPRKGVFDLLEAITMVKCRATLDIGGNKMEQELLSRIKELGIEDRVRFHGFVSGQEKLELLAGADVFVLPSYNEGLPISILEAMSYGCAIISTTVGGIPAIVSGNGILVPPGDIEALASAIDKMDERESRLKMGELSRETVKAYYPDAVMASLGELYKDLLDN